MSRTTREKTPEQKRAIAEQYKRLTEEEGLLPSVAGKIIEITQSVGRGTWRKYKHFKETSDAKIKEITENIKTVESAAPEAKITPDKRKTYILTAWEVRVGVHQPFLDCLSQLAAYYDAEQLLIPCYEPDLEFLPAALAEQFAVITNDLEFNENLFLKFVETHALVQSPLRGWAGAFPGKSAIIPGLIKELVTESSNHLAKQIMSTGSVGFLDAEETAYSEFAEHENEAVKKAFRARWRRITGSNRRSGKITKQAKEFTVPSALVVDVIDNKRFYTRYVSIQSKEQTCLFDLDLTFIAGEKEPRRHAPPGLNTGDLHAVHRDDKSFTATLAMIDRLKPEVTIVQDGFDGDSVNHHVKDRAYAYHLAPSIKEEKTETQWVLAELCEHSKLVRWQGSNHCNFIEKLLDAGEKYWRMNRNYDDCIDLQQARRQGLPLIAYLLEFDKFPNLEYAPEKENRFVGDVLVKHGHEGKSGKQVSFKALAETYNRYTDGHGHSPAVWRNAARVGTNSRLDLAYVIGASGWLAANVIIQPDNSLQLLAIIEGESVLNYL